MGPTDAVGAEPLWTQQPRVLLENPMSMFYRPSAPATNNINAVARFIVFWSVIASVFTGKTVYIVIGAVLLLFTSGIPSLPAMVVEAPTPSTQPLLSPPTGIFFDTTSATPMFKHCQMPSEHNPAANTMLHDMGKGYEKLPACPPEMANAQMDAMLRKSALSPTGEVPSFSPEADHLRNLTFYSMPSTTLASDQDAFLHATSGGNLKRSFDQSQWSPIEEWRKPTLAPR